MATATTTIPIPAQRKGPPAKYAFASLNPGESVLEDRPKDIEQKLFVSRVRASVAAQRAATGRDFVTRSEGGSIRVWRVT